MEHMNGNRDVDYATTLNGFEPHEAIEVVFKPEPSRTSEPYFHRQERCGRGLEKYEVTIRNIMRNENDKFMIPGPGRAIFESVGLFETRIQPYPRTSL